MKKTLSEKSYIDYFRKHEFKRKITNFVSNKALIVALIYASVIPQLLHMNRIVQGNILSGDWYLARQLVSLSKHRISDFNLIPFINFIDPTSSKAIFGSLGYSNGLQILSPDIILFKFFSDNLNFLIHFLFVVSIAIYYLLKLSKMFKFDNLQTTLFAVTWLSSGPLVARISEGHIQLMGYHLIPGFFYYIYLIKNDDSLFNYVRFGFFLGFIELLGSTHVYFQMCLILLFYALFNRKSMVRLMLTLLTSITSSALQLLPIIFYPSFSASTRSVYEGYGYRFFQKLLDLPIETTGIEIFKEVIGIPLHFLIALVDYRTAIKYGGWEWTLYIGFFPTLILLLVLWRFKKDLNKLISKNLFLVPVFILSISLVYRAVYILTSELVTFVAVDRVPYRMMIYILFISWLYTCYKIPIVLKKVYGKRYFVGLFILFIYFSLSISTNSWFSRHRLENQVSEVFIIEDSNVVGYELFVLLCLFLTIFSWVSLIFYAMVFRRKTLLPQ